MIVLKKHKTFNETKIQRNKNIMAIVDRLWTTNVT